MMRVLSSNYLNTTTMCAVDSNTATVENLFDGNPSFGYSSIGYLGASTTSMTITFDPPVIASRILLLSHNLKSFSIFYDGATANSLYSTTTNSDTDSFIAFASVTVSSITIDMKDTIQSAVEKQIGELIFADEQVEFERNPSINSYRALGYRKQVVHEMPDGGVRVFNIRDKFQAELSWEFVTESFLDTLRSIYDNANPVTFVPFPTTTSWDGVARECLWVGDFDFQPSSNRTEQGFSGTMRLRQTANG